MSEITTAVEVTRRIPLPATRVFALLTDPARHPEIDGSGMLRHALDARPVRGVGDTFVMAMHNDEMGDYEMTNHVVEYETDRRIAWEPVLSAATRDEDVAGIGSSAHQRWGYTLVPGGEGVTIVTETFDCSESPEWLKKAVRGGQRWLTAMAASLERLEVGAGPVQEP
ncbi:MAG TPA: SRPBCC family protein [Acidimicrobiales bacterium]|nr:SRPBCC family protein [Acidimicrobiales bacterium]